MAQARPASEEAIECWDDDADLQFDEGVQFRTASSTGSVANSFRPSGHRDSISSRRSARSDLDSNAGGDEDWQVLSLGNDGFSKEEAIASAKYAGIPIPANIPESALVGGTIKFLSSKKQKRSFVDDWSDDVEVPDPEMLLELKPRQETVFPDSLRQLSSVATSPIKSPASSSLNDDTSTRLQSALATLEQFQDEFASPSKDVPTIKSPSSQPLQQLSTVNTGTNHINTGLDVEEFDEDLELPPDHEPLELSYRKDHARVSSPTLEDFDLEWAEGSIGVRVGGTTRDGRSLPSSSISIASPSVSSCLTAESEEDGLEGLVVPDGPLDFNSPLQKRQEALYKDGAPKARDDQADQKSSADDFFSGIDVDNGKAFTSGKLTLNPNVKCKTEWPSSPTRRTSTTITFTSTVGSPRTRIPRLSGHERTHSTHLETVSESGAPLFKFRRPQSRLGHSSQSSVSSLPASGLLSTSPTFGTSGRRLAVPRPSKDTTTLTGESKAHEKHLAAKQPMPVIRGLQSTASTQAFPRHSRSDGPIRPLSSPPITPVNRTTSDGRPLGRRAAPPFLSAGTSGVQSQHASVKSYRSSRRTNSDSSGDFVNSQNIISREPRSTRSVPFGSRFSDASSGTTGPSTKRTVTRPTRRRNFGDGSELEVFDDLPTSASIENKFVKTPIGRGAPRSVRSRVGQSRSVAPQQEPSPQSVSLALATKPHSTLPRFAQDTNASRNAREQRIASMSTNVRSRDPNSLAAFGSNWKPQPVSRVPPSTAAVRSRKAKPTVRSTAKPQLIKPMGSGVHEAKSVRGMRYNPATYRWEGNENLMQDFDLPVTPKSPKPAPALITNVGTMHSVQTVGGMVFDPQRMCWLPAAGDGGAEDDVFAGLEDLDDRVVSSSGRVSGAFEADAVGDDPSAGESSDEGPITEEFDVGPEFIRRQRAEEEKWRRKVAKWIGARRDEQWRWMIRDLTK
ncbi:uncharacterized protein PFLUO_LOCUS6529 [Penicillium psychrofluorescens]|uniref:uncharacterized protein n=1 Tax=Penicillium psychrofluorescens TaxID=3158075 RepID=UPI003CCD62DA